VSGLRQNTVGSFKRIEIAIETLAHTHPAKRGIENELWDVAPDR
jgi:hypothetical protein